MNLPDRATVSHQLWQIAEHRITAEWICCEPLEPGHTLCAKGHAAIGMARALLVDSDPAQAWNPAAPVLDAVMQLLTTQARLSHGVEMPNATVILAARHLDATEGPVQVGRYVDQSTRSAIDHVLGYVARAHNGRASEPLQICELPHQSVEEEEECEVQRVTASEDVQPDTPRCIHCTHPKADHSDRDDQTPSPTVPRRPWCHACEGTCDYAAPDSPALQRLKAAARDATEAAHLHAMHGMKRVFQLCRRYGDQMIPAAEVLDALGLDENANTTVDLTAATPDAEPGQLDALMQAHTALDAQAGQDQGTLARVRHLHDSLAGESDLSGPDDLITKGSAARRIATALDGPNPAELPSCDAEFKGGGHCAKPAGHRPPGSDDPHVPATATCGRTRSTNGAVYPPCGRPPGHEEAYCYSKDGSAYFIALQLQCPNCREDLTDYAGDDYVFLKGDDRPYCSGECVVTAWRAAHKEQTATRLRVSTLLGAAEGSEKAVLNVTPIGPDTLDADEEVERAEVVHGCPPDGSGLTPCCRRTPFELPPGDRISSEAPVTCHGAPDIDLTESDIDRMMENGTPAQIVAPEETTPKTKGWGGMRGE